MKKGMIALILGVMILGSGGAFAQDGSKMEKKEMKAEKKMMKGKHHKMHKKMAKMDKKMETDKSRLLLLVIVELERNLTYVLLIN